MITNQSTGQKVPRRREERDATVPDLDRAPGLARKALSFAKRSEDLVHGQGVIVAARWIMVLSAIVFTLWSPGSLEEARVLVGVIILLAFGNFYLQAQLLMRRPAINSIVYASSAGDIAVISLVVAIQGGLSSDIFIFYFPALLALSVAFTTAQTFVFTGAAIVVYSYICLGVLTTQGDLQIIVTRAIMMAAVGVVGNLYWRIEGQRRRAALEAREQLMAQLDGPYSLPVAPV